MPPLPNFTVFGLFGVFPADFGVCSPSLPSMLGNCRAGAGGKGSLSARCGDDGRASLASEVGKAGMSTESGIGRIREVLLVFSGIAVLLMVVVVVVDAISFGILMHTE